MSLRVIRHGPLHPCRNMALDEALLRCDGPPTLRLYEWSPPGISLGYFQPAGEFQSLRGDHVLVRRITGGGAIHHDGGITFALTADAHLLPTSVPASYELIHGAVAAALQENGVATAMAGSAGRAGGRARQPWCFAEPCGADLVCDGAKVLGSAQRRLRRPRPRILHQASLRVPPPLRPPPLREALIAQISLALGLSSEPGETTEEERDLAHSLCQSYQDPRFTLRR